MSGKFNYLVFEEPGKEPKFKLEWKILVLKLNKTFWTFIIIVTVMVTEDEF